MNIELTTSEPRAPFGYRDSEHPMREGQVGEASHTPAGEPIAIIGIGCRFPGGANDPESFWKLLAGGVDAITDIPADRWDPRVYFDPEPGKPGKTNARWGGFLRDIEQFDPHFFGISPREAARMDPQQRLLMEVAWEALEDAGVALERIAESKTSVFVGISSYDYSSLQAAGGDHAGIDVYSNTGGALSIAANRISYCFNFKGPSAAVDTACSSGLVGVHLACQSMWHEGCTMALAGGVNVLLSPDGYIGFSRLSMLSPDGRCKAFDASANGFVRSEGAGMVLLKPLTSALADGDRIYAVIRATGVNQDGRTPGMTVPSLESQATLLRDTCRLAGIVPGRVQYVEAHGTGTLVGDPIEARALGTELSVGRPEGTACIIGSVKTNIGHLEPASGIAGLIKVALALKHRQIPANLHFDQPNPEIPFEALRLRVPRTLEPWPQGEGPALAGINSFGFGGTNAHAILQGWAPEDRRSKIEDRGSNGHTQTDESLDPRSSILDPRSSILDPRSSNFLLPLSARSSEALRALARSYLDFLQEEGGTVALADLCYNAGLRRSHHSHRLALLAGTRTELLDQLECVIAAEAHPGVASGHVAQGQVPGLAFVCSGQGPQWWAMGRQLLQQEPVFRAVIAQCDEHIQELAETTPGVGRWSLWQELTADEAASRMHETSIAQPALFAVQAGLAELWRSWGIVPDAVVGHSVGEVAAGYIAGVLTLEDAVRVIFHRGRCMDFAPGQGKMLAVGLSWQDARKLILPYGDRVSIAACNGPTSLTLSGAAGPLQEIADRLQKQEVFCRFLQVQYAFHSAQMDPVREPLLEALADIQPRPARLPLFSTVTGQRVAGPEWDADYWWQNVRQGVRFTDAVEQLLRTEHLTFVELSPHPVLASGIAECLSQRGLKGTIVPSLRRKEDERATMLRSLGTLYTLGRGVAWDKLTTSSGRFVRLPSYPWQREAYWHEADKSRQMRLPTYEHPLLGCSLGTAAPSWENNLDLRVLPYLVDHRVRGHAVLPATGYLEMALAAGKRVLEAGCSVLADVQLLKACFLPEKEHQLLQLVFDPAEAAFTIFSRPADAKAKWTTHARGLLRSRSLEAKAPASTLAEIRARCPGETGGAECYALLKNVGLEYGPAFQGLQRLWHGNGEALGRIVAPEAVKPRLGDYVVHPALLDACVQVVFGVLPAFAQGGGDSHDGGFRGVYLPVEIGEVRVHGEPGASVWCHARLVEKTRQGLTADLRVLDDSGKLLLELRGLRCQAVGDGGETRESLDELCYEYEWQLKPRAGEQLAQRASCAMPHPSQVADIVRADALRLRDQQHVKERVEHMRPRCEALCAALIWQALEQLGADMRPGQCFTADSVVLRLGIAAQHRRLLERLLSFLEADGFLRRLGKADPRLEVVGAPEVAEPLELWRTLVTEYPAFIADLQMLGRCGQNLAQLLRGEINPLDLIFGDGSSTAEHFYQDSPCFRYFHGVAGAAIARLVESLPEDRPIRVLEIGAGTGGLTAYTLPALPPGRTSYVFTDLSAHFLNKAEQKFRDYPFVVYQRLDIESNPLEQGYEAHSFDLILASQVLHATKDLVRTLRNVAQLLAPSGLLMLVECMLPPRWFDLVFGLLEGWWRFGDLTLRPDHPMAGLPIWQKALLEAGFTETMDVSLPEGEERFESAVILSQFRDGAARTEPLAPGSAGALPSQPLATGSWLVFADRTGVGDQLARMLRARGEHCTLVFAGDRLARGAGDQFEINPGSREEMSSLLQEVVPAVRSPWRGIIHLWNLDAPCAQDVSTSLVEAAQTPGCLSVVHLVQSWTEVAAQGSPRLWIVTGGVTAIRDGETVALVQAPVRGLGRVVRNEFPQLETRLVDLSNQAGEDEIASLFRELWTEEREDEVALRGSDRYVLRYQHRSPSPLSPRGRGEEQPPHPQPLSPEGRGEKEAPHPQPLSPEGRGEKEAPRSSYRLEVSRSNTLDGLALHSLPRRQPGPGEVEIEVCAAGLNFSDVMKALGLYPGLPDGPVPLGIECAGKIVAVGAGVEDFRVDDEVAAIAPFSFSQYLTMPALVVAHKPRHITFEEAATIPITFLTAEYALNYLGRMEAGERVLIHSATGGVGLAALQLCRKAGAEIFATAGTPEKRELLRSLGIRYVMDSRSLAFADEVMEFTNGRGVDLVLNSLAGEAIPKGLACLGDHGRFLEIGKRDIYQNTRVGLAPFKKNLSLIAIDLDRGLRERPQRIGAMFRHLVRDFDDGSLAPLPHRVFPITNAVGAFRHMAQGKHLGKVVLSLQGHTPALASAGRQPPVDSQAPKFIAEASYLITGGLGGFGLAVAQWLVANGARHLVLASRSGINSPEAAKAVAGLEQAGARVHVARADVSSSEQVATMLAEVADTMPPLRGIFHAAMVLDDCLLLNMNQERLQRVLGPKMSGAWNLHTQTQHLPLDCFVLFSTMSVIFGMAGQANYAAANSFLDALAHYRRGLGKPALSVNWGYLGNVGYVARNEKIGESFVQVGVSSFSSDQALTMLGRLLAQDACQAGVIRINWGQQSKMFASGKAPSVFADLYDEAGTDSAAATPEGMSLRKALLTAAPAERKDLLLSMLRDKVARVLGSAAAKLDLEKPLTESGLDSLMAVELRNWIEGELRLSLPIVELMRGPSVNRLTEVLLEQLSSTDVEDRGSKVEDRQAKTSVDPQAAIIDPQAAIIEYPLSAGQRSLWFLYQQAPESAAYNMADAVRMRGPLDVVAMTRAVQTVIGRHPALRTTFGEVDGKPVQRVNPSWDLPFEVIDASTWSEAELRQRLLAESQAPFDLVNGPTTRTVLLRRGPEEHILLYMMHHLVSDLWSLVLCCRETLLLYEAEKEGQPLTLPAPAATYADFVRWQSEMLAGAEGERLRSYWTKELAGELPVLTLPTDRPHPAVQTYRGAWQSRTLSRELTQAIKALSQAHGSTPFMTLLAAYNVLLHRCTGQEEVMVGCPTMGRSQTQFSSVAGYFVNPVVLRGNLAGNPSFAQLLERTRRTVVDAFDHQEYPFELLVEQLQPRRDPARSPLFQTMFLIRKAQGELEGGMNDFLMEQSTARVHMGSLDLEAVDLEEHDAQFELSLQMAEVDGCLMSALQYNSDLFDAETITRWLEHWETLLAGIVAGPDVAISDLPLLPAEEQQRLLEWSSAKRLSPLSPRENGVAGEGALSPLSPWGRGVGGERALAPQEHCVHQLFELQAQLQPDAPAVVHEDCTLSYGELNRRANQLAQRLRKLGVGPDVLVGLSVERSLDMVVGLLGILKAGGAYLPLDPEYPQERLAFMLEDARVPVLITQRNLAGRFAGQAPTLICLDADADSLAAENPDNPVPVGDPEDLAYVIYTSGSTSKPRGVLIRHRAVVNHNVDFLRRYGLQPGDRVLQFASISFDTAAEELFPALLAGATVVLRSTQATTSLSDFLLWVRQQRLTVVDLPTSYWHFWVSELTRTELPWPESLRWVIVGGEKVLPERLATWLDKVGPRANWSNGYGPTEATIQATTFSVITNPDTAGIADASAADMKPVAGFNADVVPIGRPIANTSVYLLDAHRQLVPIGVPGEAWIGGIGLARGYLNQPELTESRFLTLTLPGQAPQRLYRTGDLARFLPDGNLEFIGRIDHQVKIRGYRIELAEIESRLTEHPAVAENVVLAREDEPGQRRLVAYVVAKPDQPLTVADLRGFLKQRLPGYMVPSAFVLLPALPMTPNGKLDRQALPAPESSREESNGDYLPPRTDEERMLASIWAEVLGVGRVGMADNFFELGGDSIQGLQMVSRARQAGLHVTVRQMYQYQTIGDLVASGLQTVAQDTQVPGAGAGHTHPSPIPLTPIQHWFFEQQLGDLRHWNQAFQMDVEAMPDPRAIEAILRQFLDSHDALRLRFERQDTGWSQTLAPAEGAVPLHHADLSGLSESEQDSALARAAGELQASLDVTHGPLVRVGVFERGNGKPGRLILVVHHLVIDSVSWRILLQDFLTALGQMLLGEPIALPPNTLSFERYARLLTELAQTPDIQQDAAFWLDQAGQAGGQGLPLDHANGVNTRASAESVWMGLDERETRTLLQRVGGSTEMPIDAVLATALARALASWSGTPGVLIDLEGHGRAGLPGDVDLSHTVGWLASIYPLLVQTSGPAQEALRRTAERLRQVPHHGVSYGMLRYLDGNHDVRQALESAPDAAIRLNYIGQLDPLPMASTAIAPVHRTTGHIHQIEGTRRYLLECNGHVADGQLRLGLTYSSNLHERETVARLVEAMLAEVRLLGGL